MPDTINDLNSLKLFLLTACLAVTFSCVVYFLKRVLENFDARNKEFDERLDELDAAIAEQNARIVHVTAVAAFNSERISIIEQRLDKRHGQRQ